MDKKGKKDIIIFSDRFLWFSLLQPLAVRSNWARSIKSHVLFVFRRREKFSIEFEDVARLITANLVLLVSIIVAFVIWTKSEFGTGKARTTKLWSCIAIRSFPMNNREYISVIHSNGFAFLFVASSFYYSLSIIFFMVCDNKKITLRECIQFPYVSLL